MKDWYDTVSNRLGDCSVTRGMCNDTELKGYDEALRGKGVLVVAENSEVAGAIVGRIAGRGAEVLVVSGEASELSELLRQGKAHGEGVGGVHGLTVDLARKTELERVFRWVDGTLLHLDILVAVVEEGGAPWPPWPPGDLETWHRFLEERWVMPLLLLEAAGMRMRSRRRGHVLQVALRQGVSMQKPEILRTSRAGDAGSASGVAETTGINGRTEPMWGTLREMLESRRDAFRQFGVQLTVLEVEGGDNLGDRGGRVGGRGGVREGVRGQRRVIPEDVAAAVDFCLRPHRHSVVEAMRLRLPDFG